MGDCKDSQKPTKPRKEGLMDRARNALGRKTAKKADGDTAKNFIDHIEKADEKLGSLIQQKLDDLDSESGKERENRKKLSLLEAQAYHLDEVAKAAIQYDELC